MLTKKFTSVQYKIPLKTNYTWTYFLCVSANTWLSSLYTSMTNNSSFLLFYDESYTQRHGTYVNLLLEWNPMNECISTVSLQCIVTYTRDQNERKSSLLYWYMVAFVLLVLQYSIRKRNEQFLYLYIWFLKHF